MSLEVKIGADVADLKNALREAQSSLSEFGKSAAAVGGAFGADFSIEGATRAVINFGKEGFAMATELDAKLREVNSLFGRTGEAAEDSFNQMKGGVRELSDELGIAQTDITQGLYNAISAGIPEDNAFEFMKVAAQTATAGVTDINTAVNGLTSNLNAYGMSAKDAGKVSDGMFQVVKDGKITFAELSDSVFKIAPAANSLGVPLKEVNAAMATLTLSGTPAAVASTQIAAAMDALSKPSEKLTPIFEKLGFATAEEAIKQKGLAFAMNEVKKAAGGSKGKLTELLGTSTAAAAVTVITANNMEVMNTKLANQETAIGGVAIAFDEMNKASGDAIEDMGVMIDNLKIDIGDRLAEGFNKMAPYLQKAIEFFKSLVANSKPLKDVFTTIWQTVEGLIKSFSSLAEALGFQSGKGKEAQVVIGAMTLAMKAVMAPTMLFVKGLKLLVDGVKALIDGVKEALRWLGLMKEEAPSLAPPEPKYDFKKAWNTYYDEALAKARAVNAEKAAAAAKAIEDNKKVIEANKKEAEAAAKAADEYAKKNSILGKLNTALEKQNDIIAKAQTEKQISDAQREIAVINAQIDAIKERNVELMKSKTLTTLPQQTGTPTLEGLAAQSIAIRPVLDQAALDAAKTGYIGFMDNLVSVSLDTSQLMKDAITSAAEAMGAAIANGSNPLEAAFDSLVMVLLDFTSNFGKTLIAAGAGVEAAKKIATSGVGAVVAGAMMVASVSLVKAAMSKPPAFAQGGLVTGATIGMVGEGRGTSMSNPEVIAPLDKLQGMLGNTTSNQIQNVRFKIEGRELIGVLDASNKYNSRTGGR